MESAVAAKPEEKKSKAPAPAPAAWDGLPCASAGAFVGLPLFLQGGCGGRGYMAYAQAKLAVNQPGDAYEREADGIADAVMAGEGGPLVRRRVTPARPLAVARSASRPGPGQAQLAAAAPVTAGDSVGRTGRPLPNAIRRSVEPVVGRDLSDVQLHTGPEAARSARTIQARAFTIGSHIAFGEGQFQPATGEGLRLIAHELAHVAQQTSGIAAPQIQRWPLTDSRTDRQKIDDALRSRDPGDVKAIDNVNVATEDEKIQLLRILTYQGWVGPRDESKIEEIWRSFGAQIPRVFKENPLLFQSGIDGGADLESLAVVKKAQVGFMTDVQAIALGYLNENEAHILAEMKTYGIGAAAPTVDQDKNVQGLQAVAEEVRQAQEQEDKLRSVKVGSQWETGTEMGYLWAAKVPSTFNPQKPPDENLDGDEADKDRDWLPVKQVWDPLAGFITTIANRYPAIYAGIEQSQTIWGRDDKIAPIAKAATPAQARQLIGDVLKETLRNIREARPKILSNDPDYRDLLPIHAQMLAGTATVPSGNDWNDPFYSWVMRHDMEGYKVRQFWVRLGLQSAAAAAFVVAELATFGTATFFVAAGVGLAAQGTLAVNSVEQYLNLERLAKSATSDATAMVDTASVIEAGKKAIQDVTDFLMMLGRAIGKGLRAIPRSASSGKVQVDENKFKYLFGEAAPDAHNTPRSRQNAGQLARIGIYNNDEGRGVLRTHLEQTGSQPGNVSGTFSNQYGNYEKRESLLAGPGGFLKLESTWEVAPDGTRRLTTAIPFGAGSRYGGRPGAD